MQNKRRKFLLGLGGISAAAVLQSFSSTIQNEKDPISKGLVHIVLFWLVDDKPETFEEFESGSGKFLNSMPMVRHWHIGKPLKSERDSEHSSWNASLIMVFDSEEDLDQYMVHPRHQQAIQNFKHLWARSLVYDSLSV